jgi:hypothetical protein
MTYRHINTTQRACRVCKCTDSDCRQCIAKTGQPCYWVEEDLCSACEIPITRQPIISGIIRFIVLAMLLMVSCNLPRRSAVKCDRHLQKAIQGGCLDTTAKIRIALDTGKAVHDTGSHEIQVDTAAILRLFHQDTCYTQARVDTIKKYLKIPPIYVDDSAYKLRIWIENGKHKYDLQLPAPVTKTVYKTGPAIKVLPPKPPKCDTAGLKVIIYALLGVMLLLLILLIIVFLKYIKRS